MGEAVETVAAVGHRDTMLGKLHLQRDTFGIGMAGGEAARRHAEDKRRLPVDGGQCLQAVAQMDRARNGKRQIRLQHQRQVCAQCQRVQGGQQRGG